MTVKELKDKLNTLDIEDNETLFIRVRLSERTTILLSFQMDELGFLHIEDGDMVR